MRLRDVLGTPGGGEPQLLIGRIKKSPDTINQGVHVIVDDFDQRFEWGPCPWTPRGTDWPSSGDRALVARVRQETWVIGWWPR